MGARKKTASNPRSRTKKEVPHPSNQPSVFCTECGTTLENFCFSNGVNDLEAIRKTLAQCKKQGKFSGEFCAKLFIAHPDVFDEPADLP